MFSGAWVIILGAIIASTANKFAQLVVGRFILGAGIQMMTVAAPAYAIEISPPHWRGRCVGKIFITLCANAKTGHLWLTYLPRVL